MIDLDILAESRAKKLGQDHNAWRKAVWEISFQKLSQTLTDGEVESFLDACRTIRHLEIITRYLTDAETISGITFSQLMDKVARSGYQMDEWVDSIINISEWAETNKRTVSFFEMLILINGCASRAAPNALPLVAAVQEELKHGLMERN